MILERTGLLEVAVANIDLNCNILACCLFFFAYF